MFAGDVARVITHAALDGPALPLLRRLSALPPFERVFDSRTKISTVALARFGLTHRGFYCCLPLYFLCDGRPPAGRRRPRHIAERMLSLVPCASGQPADASGRLEASAASQAVARERLADGHTYVGVAPGSRQADKNWPLERFCEAAQALIARGVTPVFLLGPQEGAVEARIHVAAPGAMVLRADPQACARRGARPADRRGPALRSAARQRQRRRAPVGRRRRPGGQPVRPDRPRPLGPGGAGQHHRPGKRLRRRSRDRSDPGRARRRGGAGDVGGPAFALAGERPRSGLTERPGWGESRHCRQLGSR